MKPTLWLVALCALAASPLAACGAGVTHARRDGVQMPERDPVLVRVVTSPTADARVVSFSVVEGHVSDPLPAEPSDDAIAEMRAEAGRRGAVELYLDRVDTPYRRAFFGLGLAPGRGDTSADACAHGGFADALADAREQATRCVARARRARPALRGHVEIIFQVDAFGRAMRAAATPDSSKDGELRNCGIEAAFDGAYGAPPSFTCRGRFRVDVGDTEGGGTP